MRKKALICLFLAAAMLFCAVACDPPGGKDPSGDLSYMTFFGKKAGEFKSLKFDSYIDAESFLYEPNGMKGVFVVFSELEDELEEKLVKEDDPQMPADEIVDFIILREGNYALPGGLAVGMDISKFIEALGRPGNAWDYEGNRIGLSFRLVYEDTIYYLVVYTDYRGENEAEDVNAFWMNPTGKVEMIGILPLVNGLKGDETVLDLLDYSYGQLEESFGPLSLYEIIHGGTFIFKASKLPGLYFNFDCDTDLYEQFVSSEGEDFVPDVKNTAKTELIYINHDIYLLPGELGIGTNVTEFVAKLGKPIGFYADMDGYILVQFAMKHKNTDYTITILLDVTEEDYPEFFNYRDEYDAAKFQAFTQDPFGYALEIRISKK